MVTKPSLQIDTMDGMLFISTWISGFHVCGYIITLTYIKKYINQSSNHHMRNQQTRSAVFLVVPCFDITSSHISSSDFVR